ncbi:MAG: PIN domain-containing protein [Betaproteobacteria bacterium]
MARGEKKTAGDSAIAQKSAPGRLCRTLRTFDQTFPKARSQLIERFAALALLQPDRADHIEAAEVRNTCRKNGVQIGTIDAVLIQLCMRHDLVLLSTDNDVRSASKHVKFRLWTGAA